MGIRETLNQNPIVVGAGVVVILVIAALIIFSSGSDRPAEVDAYYTTDDGATWFAYEAEEMPPVNYNGKQAVRAYLFRCADGKEFVGYLERYSDEAKATLDGARKMGQQGQRPDLQKVQSAAMTGRMVKRPSDKQWATGADMRGVMKVQQVTCPDGSPATIAQ